MISSLNPRRWFSALAGTALTAAVCLQLALSAPAAHAATATRVPPEPDGVGGVPDPDLTPYSVPEPAEQLPAPAADASGLPVWAIVLIVVAGALLLGVSAFRSRRLLGRRRIA